MMNQAINKDAVISNQYVHDLDRQYVFHSWSVQGTLNPLVIAGGNGCTLFDYDGKQYLDFSSDDLSLHFGVPAAGLARTTATFVALSTAYYRGTTDGFALAEATRR